MNLSDYPRPPGDNGRGMHWSPKQQNHGIHNWELWEDTLKRMQISWVKVVSSPDEDGVKVFRRLAALRIMPVVRYIDHMPSVINAAQLDHARELWHTCGVPYVERVNEPDADVEWTAGSRPPGWELDVAAINIEDALRIQAQGQIPLIAMYNAPVGGPNCIQLMLELEGARQVLSGPCALSIHNYGKGRPLEYPNDDVHMFGTPLSQQAYLSDGMPPAGWSEAQIREFVWNGSSREQVNSKRQATKNPNDTIMTNITNFRMFEYWMALWAAEGLPPCPLIGTEAGWEVDDLEGVDHGKFPQPTADLQAAYQLQQARFQDGSDSLILNEPDGTISPLACPADYFTSMNWLIAEQRMGEGGQWEQGAWMTHWHDQKYGLSGELPIVQLLQDTPPRTRTNGPVPPQWVRWTPYPASWYETDYDSRIDYIAGDQRILVHQPEGPGWYIKSLKVQWPNDDPAPFAGGYIFVKAYRDGQQVDDVQFVVNQDIIVSAKHEPDWADLMMNNPRPAYSIRMNEPNSAMIEGLGLGIENKPSWDRCTFIVEFEYRQQRSQNAMTWIDNEIARAVAADAAGEPPIDEVAPYLAWTLSVDPSYPEPTATIRPAEGLTQGEEYWKVIYIGILPGGGRGNEPNINNMQHHAFVEVLGLDGERVRNPAAQIRWGWEGMSPEEAANTGPVIVDKPPGEFGGNVAIVGTQQMVYMCAPPFIASDPFGDGRSADWVEYVHTAWPDRQPGNSIAHTSTFIIYKLSVWGGDTPVMHTINLQADPPQGGSVVGGGQYQAGQTATISAMAIVGWQFTGWYWHGDLVSASAVYSFEVEGDVLLQAGFSETSEPPLPGDPPLIAATGQTTVMFNKAELQAIIDNAPGETVALSFII